MTDEERAKDDARRFKAYKKTLKEPEKSSVEARCRGPQKSRREAVQLPSEVLSSRRFLPGQSSIWRRSATASDSLKSTLTISVYKNVMIRHAFLLL